MSKKIEEVAKTLDREIKLMNVCGTHEMNIVKHGLRDLIPEHIKLIAGPGCPVCVTPAREINESIKLAHDGKIVTTFGDMYRVPGTSSSLLEAKTEGADVEVVYGISDSVEMAKDKPDREVVHAAVGFETTAPTTAAEIYRNPPENFSILSSHRIMPPIMEFLLSSEKTEIDGYICPGHVSTIIGSKPYEFLTEKFGVHQVIAGFEPLDILLSVLMLLQQIDEERKEVENEYERFVKPEGNQKAKQMIDKIFQPVDDIWRGFPTIPLSKLELKKKYEKYDARKKYKIEIEEEKEFAEGCRCGEVLRGLIVPPDCPLFLNKCKPDSPTGPCMVSAEGACNVWAKHGESTRL
ncbi:hydrogenase assembly protein HupF [candidate division MSBL1 archaeon SCGC-AAA382C18]|uniref:Hydrogenase assembly protein HupF n=1 Tax=candidate division MSBL1 archaeon SCGC-AAA382C18 TaxID=1698281 RepID=A0A133VIF6_9EURY|nr:hydrogenase assembly protein HupF [candidate division MSBL1 archaeon SCGC-AAA382C18]